MTPTLPINLNEIARYRATLKAVFVRSGLDLMTFPVFRLKDT